MNTWQQNFLRDLDQLKSQWQHRFEAVADNWLGPVFAEFEDFACRNGFLATCPQSGAAVEDLGVGRREALRLDESGEPIVDQRHDARAASRASCFTAFWRFCVA